MAVNLNDTSGTQGTSIINSQQSEDIKNTLHPVVILYCRWYRCALYVHESTV